MILFNTIRPISTHAPRAGSDPKGSYTVSPGLISTHAPRAGSDLRLQKPSARDSHFNPRSPCGERQFAACLLDTVLYISTHAPRAGSDSSSPALSASLAPFQPTLPVRGATRNGQGDRSHEHFSTHAPRAGSDPRLRVDGGDHMPISTHAPRAGSDQHPLHVVRPVVISTHAPRAGSDAWRGWRRSRPAYFNPRSPCGERPTVPGSPDLSSPFQPTLPVRGATPRCRVPRT